MVDFTFYGITEDRPAGRWQALFDAVWPAYRAWYLRDGDAARPDLATAESRLRRHMPELVPTWQRLVDLAGGDETAARMLTLWNPPRFLPGCSQVALRSPEPALLRNYDYGLELFEQVHSSTRYGSRRVIGTSDCLWGLLDGMNDNGLAVSLAFGGRPGAGDGFAAPLVVRYLLEVAGDVAEAVRRLETIPVSMFYNLTMVDASGAAVTAYVGPGMRPEVVEDPVATNHRGRRPEFPDHARRFRSVERQDLLTAAVDRGAGAEEIVQAMLGPGVFSHDYDNAFGTLYTAIYRPLRGEVEYRWHSRSWTRSFTSTEETITVTLDDAAPESGDATWPTGSAAAAGAGGAGAWGAAAGAGTWGAAADASAWDAASGAGTRGVAPGAGAWGAASGAGTRGAAPGAGTWGAASGAGTRGAASGAGTRGAAPGAGTGDAASGAGTRGAAPGAGARGAASGAGTRGAAPGAGTWGAAADASANAWGAAPNGPAEPNGLAEPSGPAEPSAAAAGAAAAGTAAAEPIATATRVVVADLHAVARQAVHDLAHAPDPAAFSALLSLSAEVGEALGTSARLLAQHNSWARVAEIADVSRQAAWHRWR